MRESGEPGAGSQLVIDLKSGAKMQGLLDSCLKESLLFKSEASGSVEIPKEEVSKVVHRTGRPDSPWDGALMGAGIGLGPFFVGHALALPDDPWPTHGQDAILIPISVGAGMALGYFLDRRGGEKQQVVYRAR